MKKNNTKKLCFLLIWAFVMCFHITNKIYAQPNPRIEKLENTLKMTRNDTTKVQILNNLYNEYLNAKESTAKIRKYAEEALHIAEKAKFVQGIIISADNVGNIYQLQGDYNKAIEFFLKALSLKENQKDNSKIADSYNRLGACYVLLNENEKALNFLEKALNIRQNSKDKLGIATTYTNLGIVFYKKTEYEKAIQYHQKALAMADSLLDRKLIANNLHRLGETFFQQNNIADASRSFRQLLYMAQRSGDSADMQKAYQGLAQIAVTQSNYKQAYEFYQQYANIRESYFKELQNTTQGRLEESNAREELERKKRALIEAESHRQTLWIYLLIAMVLLVLVIVFFLYRSNILSKKTNKMLKTQKDEIEKTSKELSAQKEILEASKAEIETKNKALESSKTEIESKNDAINRKNEILEATFKEIDRKNKDITASITYAKRIQESMLPTPVKITEGFPENFILFRPRDIVSGDFYWFSQKNGKIIFAALDCTGHGVPGAIMSMLGDSYLNQIINLQGITDPNWVLEELHNSIGIALNQEETQNQDGMDVALCIIDPRKKKLEFAGAGRPLLLIQNGEMSVVESSKLPVGGFQKDRERIFTSHTFNYSPENPLWIYVYSDGFQDQFGGQRGRKFSKNRLEELLFEHHQESMPEQRKILNKTLIDWMGTNRQMDDILVAGFKLT
jgi:serine phosphatase RsbU (regulator of sigma subunit)/lipopolysaccharide biosynthesis regulator YciM